MTTENQTQGDIDQTTEGEQAILDAAAQAAAEAAAAKKAADDATGAAAEPAKTEVSEVQAPVVAPTLVAPSNIVDPALVGRDFDAEQAALAQKWEDGDLDQATYMKQMQAIAKDQAKLEAQQTTAAALQQMQSATAEQAFAQLAEAFVAQVPDLADATRRAVFSDLVVKVDTETGRKLPDWQLLQETYKRFSAAFPAAGGSAPVTPTAKPTPRGADLTGLPPRLAGLPAGPQGTSEIETLANMSIEDIEDHLARLTPDARDALLMKLEQQAA